jgi:hypothetical protein
MTTINISDIIIDERFQARVTLDTQTVEEYAEAIDSGATLPAIDCVSIDGKPYVVDGFHRLAAHIRAGKRFIEADVMVGTEHTAYTIASAANAEHGLRRTNADKERAVRMLLRASHNTSDRKAAKHCGVSHPFIASIRHKMSEEEATAAGAPAPKAKAPKSKPATSKAESVTAPKRDVTGQVDGFVEESLVDVGDVCPTCGRGWE